MPVRQGSGDRVADLTLVAGVEVGVGGELESHHVGRVIDDDVLQDAARALHVADEDTRPVRSFYRSVVCITPTTRFFEYRQMLHGTLPHSFPKHNGLSTRF